MTAKKIAALNILLAVLFALAILLSSALYPAYYPTSMYILLALWFIPSTLLNIIASKKQ